MPLSGRRSVRHELNHCMPAAHHAKLGDLLTDLVTNANADTTDGAAVRTSVVAIVTDLATLRTAFNTLTAKLNGDAGVTDTNYATLGALTAAAPAALTAVAVTDIESR